MTERVVNKRAFGTYTSPRLCVCGKAHLDRATYWEHRLEAEKAAEKK